MIGIKNQAGNSRLNLQDFNGRIIIVNDSYKNIKYIARKNNFSPISGILIDLGMSSWQLEKANKGFTFQKDEALDMRYSLDNELTAEKIINEFPEDKIEKILEEYGEERFARKIARKIAEERQKREIKTTFELARIISEAIPGRFKGGNINFSTKSFQALRIAVNGELENLRTFLPDAIESLEVGGRLVVISFHSLEDRIVKNFFNEAEKENKIKILTKKPVVGTAEEILKNPRSRSAKLRAVQKI